MIILETKQSVQCCRSIGGPNGVHTKFLWHADSQDILRYQLWLNREKQLREVRESWKVLGELTEEPCGTGWAAGVGRLGGRAGTGKVWKGSTELVVEWEAEGKTSQRWHGGGAWRSGWIKCPVDACETKVSMTQLGWESSRPVWLAHYGTDSWCGSYAEDSQPLCWKHCSGTAESRLRILLKRWLVQTERSFQNTGES